jgi:PAS domain S-box-containing protein
VRVKVKNTDKINIEPDQKFSTFIDAAPDAIVVTNKEGVIVMANQLAAKMFEFSRVELLGNKVEMLVPKRYLETHIKYREEYFKIPITRRMGERRELSGKRKDGSEFSVEISLGPLTIEKENFVISIIRDITFRKKSEAKFQGLLESAPDGIVVIDTKGLITVVNGQTEKLFGYTKGELLGSLIEILVPDKFKENHVKQRDDYIAAPHRRPMGTGRFLNGRRKDGTEFPAEISLSPLETEQGTLVICIVRDITERRRIENVRDEFLSIASHELKTPLTSLMLQAQIFMRAQEKKDEIIYDRERLNKMVEQTYRQVVKLTSLIEDILDISRIRTGKFTMELEQFGLKELMLDILERLKPQFIAANCGIPHFISSSDEIKGKWDRQRIGQVINILLNNSLSYAGGHPVIVTLKTFDNNVQIEVKDEGVGIAKENIDKIFDRFERMVDANEVSGMGLGLYIAREIVLAHKGKIWVDSELGKGSTFFVNLPLSQRSSND